MTIRQVITVAALAASSSITSAQNAPPMDELAPPPSISMTCQAGRGGGEFDVLFDKDDKTLSFVPGDRLPAKHRFAHGQLIIHAEQDEVEYAARLAERPFVTIRENKRLDIFPCSNVKTSPGAAPATEVHSGWLG